MTRIKIPTNEFDLTNDAAFLVTELFKTINLYVISHSISDENIELATEWVANQYEDKAR